MKNEAYADNAAVTEYVDFYIENLPAIAEGAQFIALDDASYEETQTALSGIGS